jgi:hypothetical protein
VTAALVVTLAVVPVLVSHQFTPAMLNRGCQKQFAVV